MSMLAELDHRAFAELLELASGPLVTQLDEIRDAIKANTEAIRLMAAVTAFSTQTSNENADYALSQAGNWIMYQDALVARRANRAAQPDHQAM